MVTAAEPLPPSESSATMTPAGNGTAAIDAMRAIKFRIPGDIIATATHELPDEQRTLIRWFAGYLRARNLSPDECERVLRKDGKSDDHYSWASIYAVLTGRRTEQGASIAPVLRAIEALRKVIEGDSRLGAAGYVPTRLGTAIFDRLDRARERRKIAFIVGDSQIGKTESRIEYTRLHNHGSTISIDCPPTGTRSALVQTFCEVLNIGQAHRIGDVEMRIAECFDRKMLLIVDNAHRMLRHKRGLLALTFLQWLYDQRGCGMGIFLTNEGYGNLLGGTYKKELEQLWRRRIPPLRLPARTPDDDLALFAAKFGLEPATGKSVKIRVSYFDETGTKRERDYERVPAELQAEVVTKEGLGVWLETLEEAQHQADVNKRAISWHAVLKAHCVMQADGEVLL